ncbi:MAG: Type 1 glutamine amidotransferase-like domain-containing protein [bacterium]|nr:Type 1 glutamine amidotransferase-like domain-containing protein [bacterium]
MMKLLLASFGLNNDTIAEALFELVGKTPNKTKVSVVPTAANIYNGDKEWFINDLLNIKKYNFLEIDIVDISALPKESWKPRLEKADVLFFEGGDPFYLMKWILKTGLDKMLPELLKTRVYVGSSSGAIVLGQKIPEKCKDLYESNPDGMGNIDGLGIVNFTFLSHYKEDGYPLTLDDEVGREIADELNTDLYAIDDNTAIQIDGEKIKVVSEGQWAKFNK